MTEKIIKFQKFYFYSSCDWTVISKNTNRRPTEKNIQDFSDNKTRFILLGLDEIPASESDKTSIVFSSNNKPGSLFKILEPLAKKNINLTKLESRPIKSSNWEYFIYLDLNGHINDKKVKFCLDSIKSHTKFFKILGSYPRSIL